MPEVDWALAKCTSVDPEVMYPPSGRPNKKIRNAAKAICRGRDGRNACPVREACRDWAIEIGDYNGGIWGGLSDRERKNFSKTGQDPCIVPITVERPSCVVAKDEDVPGGKEAGRRPRPRRADRANAPGAGGRGKRTKKSGRPARQRTGEVIVLPTRRLPTNHGCPTARGLGEDAVAGDLRGRPRRSREVAAMDTSAGASVRAVAMRRLRVVMDGDIA